MWARTASLFMDCEGGEVKEEEVEVVDGAPESSRGLPGKILPNIGDSGALCEKVEDGWLIGSRGEANPLWPPRYRGRLLRICSSGSE
jgi:hypothetical protein